jgi:protein FAM50
LELSFSLWDGDNTDRELMHIAVKKGSTIYAFLETAKQEYKELRAISTNDIMFVKQDLIVSQVSTNAI